MYPYMSKPKLSHNVEVSDEIIRHLLTDSEWRMIKHRSLIIRLLEEGRTIRAVAEKVGVGTDTVVRVAKRLKSTPKLRQAVSQKLKPSASKWVFGQVGSEKE